MKIPRKAVILAAGYGERMDPLSRRTPKPLMPVWGRATIDHTLDILSRWGVREALINLHHGGDAVFLHLRTRHRPRLSFSYEPAILGTGGALKRASWFIGDSPFWVVNGDIAFDLDTRPMFRDFCEPNTIATLWLTDRGGPRTVETQNRAVTTFRSARAGHCGTYTFCGLQLLAPDILNDIPQEKLTSIVDAYERSISRGKRVGAVCVPDAYWADLGTPESYIAAHSQVLQAKQCKQRGGGYVSAKATRRMREIRKTGVHVDGFASIPATVPVDAGARLQNVVALGDSKVGAGCYIVDAIVASPVPAGASITRLCLPAGQMHDPALLELLNRLEWPVERTLYQPFAPRGSARKFSRVICGKRSAIVMQYDETLQENARYVPNSEFLAGQGIPVPKILRHFRAQRTVVVEDVGERSLGRYLEASTSAECERVYRRVLDAVALLHGPATRDARRRRLQLEQPFGTKLYAWERALFRTNYLRKRLNWSAARTSTAMREFRALGIQLCKLPCVLIHRDLQSSNILLRGTEPVFIDFQGMRFGVAEYDLASLISDPYVCLPLRTQEKLVRYYASITQRDFPFLLQSCRVATVQRLGQAIGAYSRLGAMPGTTRFYAYIMPALEMMQRALRNLDNVEALASLVDDAYQHESRLGI